MPVVVCTPSCSALGCVSSVDASQPVVTLPLLLLMVLLLHLKPLLLLRLLLLPMQQLLLLVLLLP